MADHSHPTRDARRLFDLPRPVWLLGWVSLATDSASEAIYPLLPFFLTQVLGAGAVSLGIVEGAAEAANSVLKIVSGRMADRSPAKRQIVLAGYSLSPVGPVGDSFVPLPPEFTRFMIVLTLFMLGNSTDAFLLLRLTDAAGSAKYVPLMWSALHVVKATVSMVGGAWSDRIGRRGVITIGWLVYAVVYAGFGLSASLPALLAWFLGYGFYFGFAEG